MWFDCNNVIINLDHVDYIHFERTDDGYKATVYFENGDSLNFAHSDLDMLKNHFRKVLEDGHA